MQLVFKKDFKSLRKELQLNYFSTLPSGLTECQKAITEFSTAQSSQGHS